MTRKRFPKSSLLLLLCLSSCLQDDPAVQQELSLLKEEHSRILAELSKLEKENKRLKEDASRTSSTAPQTPPAVPDKAMLKRSFVEAVTQLQEEVEAKYPGESVASYQIFDINLPSDTPISSSVSFTLQRPDSSQRNLSFLGSANLQGEWNFASTKEIVQQQKAPPAPPNPTPVTQQPSGREGTVARPPGIQIQRQGSSGNRNSSGAVRVIDWGD